jgi:hypothetical protein
VRHDLGEAGRPAVVKIRRGECKVAQGRRVIGGASADIVLPAIDERCAREVARGATLRAHRSGWPKEEPLAAARGVGCQPGETASHAELGVGQELELLHVGNQRIE